MSLFPVSIYSFGYAFEILCTSLEGIKFWIKVEYLGISFLPVAWLMFALNFNGYKDKVKNNKLVLLYIVPVITLILNYTNDFHHLFYKKLYMNSNGVFPIVEMVKGPGYWLNIAYTYALMIIGLIIFVLAYFKAVSIIRKQILFLIIAWIIPWLSDIIYMLHLLPFDLDLCPLAFSVSGMISSYAIFKFKLLKLTPIALEKVFSNMLDGVIILDSQNNIVNFNPASKNIIWELKDIAPGDKKIHEVLKEYKSLLQALNSDSYNESLISIKNKERLSYYKMNINNIYENNGEIVGKILILNEVTEQKENEEKINKLLKLKEAMLKIGYSFNDKPDINDLFQLILDEVINCVDERSSGSILLLDEDKNLKVAVSKGYDLEKIKTFSVKLEEHFARFNKGENINKTVIFDDLDKMKEIKMLDTAEGMKIKSSVSSPIIIEGQLYGFLNIDSMYNNFFNEGDLEFMEYMRNQVSIAITKHKLYEETVYLSRYDRLTNVYNRSYFEQLLHNSIHNENTNKKDFFVVVFDINGLKFVNDNYGHLAGDELIKLFSRGLRTLAGESDIIGRFGGDEFVGVFFNLDSQSIINSFEELVEHFKRNPIIFGGNKIICSYSYGVVSFPKDGIEFDQLIKIADKRMYEYKSIVKSKKSS
jgi:diguanylate cyclase (GGDEF)-like protein